ncbi:MAG: hypothetical protein IPL59_23840, partial [Candidatus Competibacteraceae bacterium]|nr:hypothetical protein [Candidatus Competibacteraceae bacterium]
MRFPGAAIKPVVTGALISAWSKPPFATGQGINDVGSSRHALLRAVDRASAPSRRPTPSI